MADFNIVQNRESDEENKFSKWATNNGLMPIKLNISGRRGLTDRLVLGHSGRAIFIEFKKPRAKPTKLQLHNHQILAERGFKCFVVTSFDDAKFICERHLLY